eukprot:COSAG01_NODE_13897_length_1520_cov_1.921182_2_plen_241_part_00
MPRLFLSRNIEDEDGAPGGSGSGAEPEPERRAGGRGRGGGWIHPPRLLRGGRGGGGGAGSECFPRVDWVAVPEALRARRVSTGAGGDNRVAKMWKRRGISASSGYDRSHDLPPAPAGRRRCLGGGARAARGRDAEALLLASACACDDGCVSAPPNHPQDARLAPPHPHDALLSTVEKNVRSVLVAEDSARASSSPRLSRRCEPGVHPPRACAMAPPRTRPLRGWAPRWMARQKRRRRQRR